jgi:hypothetical protein
MKTKKETTPVIREVENAGICRQGIIDSDSVMEVFRWICSEAKKNFKKKEKINTTLLTSEDSCSLRLVADDLDVQLIIREGGKA